MAEVSVSYDDGKYSDGKGVFVHLEICVKNPDRESNGKIFSSQTKHMEDPSVSVLALPMKRYSKTMYAEFLKKFDPYVPELCAAYEANQEEGTRKLNDLVRTLF